MPGGSRAGHVLYLQLKYVLLLRMYQTGFGHRIEFENPNNSKTRTRLICYPRAFAPQCLLLIMIPKHYSENPQQLPLS
jgi:hypothetical protein